MSGTLRSAGSAAVAFTLTAGIIGLMAAEPAAARDLTVTAPIGAEVATERLSTAGLDLSHAEGVRILEGRVRAASRRVCSLPTTSLAAPGEFACRRSAIAGAAPAIARLSQRAQALAAAGQPTELQAVLVVSAPRG